jgi:hypothetical protein
MRGLAIALLFNLFLAIVLSMLAIKGGPPHPVDIAAIALLDLAISVILMRTFKHRRES